MIRSQESVSYRGVLRDVEEEVTGPNPWAPAQCREECFTIFMLLDPKISWPTLRRRLLFKVQGTT